MMAGLRSVCLLLEKHRDVICEDVNVDEVVPDLVAKGILNTEDKKALAAETSDRTKGELLVSLLGKKGFAAFQEFCHVLEKSHPHLITCFLMDFAAGGVTPSVTSGGDTESQYSLDSATREQHRIRGSHDSASLYGTLSRRRSSVRRNRSTATPPPPSEPPDPDSGPSVYSDPGGSGTLPSGSTVGSVSESSEPHLTEVLEEPVTEEPGGERVVWEFHQVSLNRVPGYGFGIAVSGGRDNPHFTTGDPSIAISDVLKAGPAEGKLHVNDRVLSANGISLENVDYGTAVQVLKDSGAVVHLYVKRRVVLPASLEPQTYKLVLNKAKKKDDFGIVLGCHIYVKEISGRTALSSEGEAGGLQEGDTVLRINHMSTDGLTLKEARKLLDTTKDRLGLTVRRDPSVAAAAAAKNQRLAEGKLSPPRGVHQEERNNYSNQNLYVQPPTRGSDRSDYGRIQPQTHQQPSRHGQLTNGDDKNNLIRQNGRGRGPLMEVSLSQLDQPATPLMRNHLTPGSEELPPPPRPPVPRDNVNGAPMTNGVNGHHPTYSSDYGEMSKSNYDHSPKSKANVPDPRFVSFQKDGSVGIRLAGGNETGIFVTAVQSGSPAALQGLQPGDKIIKVNGMEMKGVTREEAVLFLLSLQDQIDLIVQHRKDEHDEIIASQRGDSFYIRTHFNHEQTGKNELSFRKGDIFHVVDTLNMGVVGAWQVFRIGRNNEETQKGVVPNKSRAEELATAQFNAAKKVQSTTETRSRFFSRRRRQGRSKSLGKDHWEDVVFSDAVSKFPAYERVALRGCSFVRPVVLFGGVSDLARDQLLKDMPDKFAAPHLPDLGVLRFHDNYIKLDMADDSRTSKHSGIIRLSAIRELVELGRHALLDVTPNAVDRLNYAQLYPICIFLRAESKHIIKEVRTARAAEKPQQKSSKKMFDQCVKLEKLWSHVFTASITMTDADGWYRRIRELIDKQQNAPIWMSETKPGESLSDDYLFPMTSRLSFVSSPESDVEGTETSPTRSPASSAAAATSSSGSCDQLQQPRLGRSSSDPSLAPEDLMQAPGPPPYSPYSQQQQPQGLHDEGLGRSAAGTGSGGGKRGSHGSDSRYGFSPTRYPADADDYPSLPVSATSKHHPHPAPSSPRSPYQTLPHDFRPNGVVQQHPAHSQHHSPPSVDRTSKPVSPGGHGGTRSYGRASGGQMRNYMVNGGGALEDNYMNTVVNGNGSGNGNYAPASERHRGGPYDGSPTSYDSYQRFNNMHDDLKARSLPPQELLLASAADGTAGPPQQLPLTNGSAASGRSHDPYRFTRSTAQPSAPTAGDATVAQPSQTHRSYSGRFELKPPPPPKNSVSLQSHLQQYKPIPPPKPKGFRGPPASASDSYRRPADSRRTPDSRGSREDFAGFLATNGGVEDGGGFDSGHGSSLDRNGESQRTYMNMKPAPPGSQTHYLNMPPTSSSKDPLLDLSNRDQRGSAFELYKKPHIESRYPSAAYNVEHAAGASVHSSSVPPESPWACLSPRRRSALRSLSSCSSSPRRRRGSLPTEPSSAPFLDLPTSPPSSPSRQQATARGVFTHEGGVLHDPHTRVSILIPPGAIPPGRAQEIYFNVCGDNSYLPPLDTRKGETLLSPLVMCGPQGLHFDIPVQLQLPHCAAVDPDSWSFALKSTADGGRSDAWRKMRLSADGSTSRVEADCVSVLVDHF